ncbi:MAG: hypothetical protein OEW58_13570, partial [Gammaproteobacteria bacterium]|nr:hypothetical protein [Gammaproteobacteria bacterium]
MTLPLKSSAVCALIASTLLLGACSTSEEDAGVWSVQDVYSGNSVSKPQVAQAGNGDLIVIWQEFERGDIQADTAKNAAHDPQKTDPALILANSEHGAHDHYFQCQRTNIWVRRYDAATDTWEAATQLQTGKWRKTTTYLADDSLTPPLTADQYELDENVAKPLDSGATLALDGSGNALAVWNQNLVDDCNAIPTVATAPVLYAVRYDITSRSWASPATVQNNSNNIADAKNLQIKLNSAGAGLIAWEQVLNDSQNVGAQNLPAVYAAGYNGTTVGTPTLINDSITSGGYTLLAAASQPALDVNSNGDGVIAWRHVPRKANITDEPVSEIRVKRFTATGSSWGTSLTLGSGTARTANYTPSSSVESPAVTLDDSDRIWTIWIDDSRTDTNSGTITNRLAKTMVNDVSDADVIGTA